MREQTTASDGQVDCRPAAEFLKTKPPEQVGITKAEALRKRLSRRGGATVAQIKKRLIWQPHTVRAAISRLRMSGVSIELDRSGRVALYRAMSSEDGQ